MSSKVDFGFLELHRHQWAIVSAVRAAGEQLIGMQSAICDSGQVAVKLDGTVVTSADTTSEDTLLAAIQKHAPRPHQVVSEESSASAVIERAQLTWFVDPLDGTRSYATGSTDFAVLVSEWAGDVPRFSVVYYPALGQLAIAAGERAAWMSAGAAPSTCAEAPPTGVVHFCYMRSRALRRSVTEAGAECHEEEAESTRALVDVATGAAKAAVVRLCGHKSWDLAPLLHLLTATGAIVTDETGRPVRLFGPEVSGRYVVAARDPSLHRILGDAMRDLAAFEL